MILHQETLWLLATCLNLLFAQDPAKLRLALLFSVFASAVVGWCCWRFPLLWNTQFRAGFIHYGSCALAATATLVFTLTFFGISYTPRVAEMTIAQWEHAILLNPALTQVGAGIIAARRNLGSPQIEEAAERAEALYHNFRATHPAVSSLIAVTPASASIRTDAEQWLVNHAEYPLNRVLTIVASDLLQTLNSRTERLLVNLRLTVALAFTLTQAISFGVTGYRAYADINLKT